jgi:mycothiol synthase
LAAAAELVDGIAPLNDDALFALAAADATPEESILHFSVADSAGAIVAYAHLGSGPTGQVVVAPDHRRCGIGTALVAAIRTAAPTAGYWSFGDLPAAQALARREGLEPVRILLQMTRDLTAAPLVPYEVPATVLLRTFAPGDVDALVAVNARAFVHHPEQGGWTRRDVEARLAADWFNPAGLLVAEAADTGALVGFHWTKVHPADPVTATALGEVYVLAVDPAWSGQGIGRALLEAGIAALAQRGLDRVLLYVEGANDRVVHLYSNSGFWISRRDIRYAARRHEREER